ncbi:hypothetical protein KX816_11040 [Sphingosinicellaceae bacterium]|nr:hypothetical protein KX816_11040 [Sphingosinicellaceae bacterium]
MSDRDIDDVPPRRWPAALLLAAALVWLGVAAAIAVIAGQNFARLAESPPAEVAILVGSFVLQMLPPLAVAILAFGMLRRQRPDTAARLAAIDARHRNAAVATHAVAHDLEAIDVMLDHIDARVATLNQRANAEGRGLTDAAGALDAAAARLVTGAETVRAAGSNLTATLPEADERAQRLAALLDTSARENARQSGELETMLSGLWAATDDAVARHDAAVGAARERLTALTILSTETAAKVGNQGDRLHALADAALGATTAALDTTRAGVEAQTAALLASVDQAKVAMDHIGGEAMRVMQKRLDRLLEAADSLGQSLTEQDARSRVFVDTVERSFNVLEAKLGNAATTGNTTLDALGQRIQAVRDTVHTLNDPLGTTHDAVGAIEAAVARLEHATNTVVANIGATMPTTGENVAGLAQQLGTLHEQVGALAAPVGATETTLGRIIAQLSDARASANEVETATGTAALTASNQLIEVLGRVREVAAATAGTMRTTLEAVVAEAEVALAGTGDTMARNAFGTPIRAQLDAVTEASDRAAAAAQAAAERVTQRLLGLTQTVANVEARIDEVDTRYDVMLREDLARRSEGLIESLNSAAIDVTKLLAIDVGDQAWTDYLKGDHGVFARRAVRLLDRETARKIERHYSYDAPFREQAIRFITEFETLLKRVMPDREGKALAVTLLSSDLGKLYVVLAQATERLRE